MSKVILAFSLIKICVCYFLNNFNIALSSTASLYTHHTSPDTWYITVSKGEKNSPKIAEPLDELSGIVLVESNVGKVNLQHRRARISNVEKHQLRLAQMHRCQSARLVTLSVKDIVHYYI